MRSPKWNMPVDGGATLPASIKTWLGQQLELRGIDAVIYTRYILSILQQDGRDLELGEQERDLFQAPAAVTRRGGAASSSGCKPGRVKAKGSKRVEKKVAKEVDVEELRKTAAVQCLLSVTDEEAGIENLVEELCLRLKEQKLFNKEVSSVEVDERKLSAEHSDGRDSTLSSSPEDPAERYYAAFPPLTDEQKAVKPKKVFPDGCVWAKLAQKSHSSGQASDEEPLDTASNNNDNARQTKPKKAETARGTTQPTKDRSMKAKISKLEVKLKPKPRRSHTNEDHREKDEHSPRLLRQRSTAKWRDKSENPIFFVPKVLSSSKDKRTHMTACCESNAFESEDLKCAWLMRLLERNRAQQQAEVEATQHAHHAEEACIFEWEAPDTMECDLNLSMLYGQEDQSWYTKPIDDFLALRPVLSQRLYKRHSDGNQEGGSATLGGRNIAVTSDIPDFTADNLQAILTELLSPQSHDQEVESDISRPDSESQFYNCMQDLGHSTPTDTCFCGSNRESDFQKSGLPPCKLAPSIGQSSASSPIELAAQAIPNSTENDVLDDRPGSHILRLLHESNDSYPDVAAELDTCVTQCPSASPIVTAPYDHFLLWKEGLDAEMPLNLESCVPCSLGVFNMECALPSAQLFSGLPYGNICDTSTASNGNKMWLQAIPDETSLPSALHNTLCDTNWDSFGTPTSSATTVPYISPLKAQHISQIWDVNTARRQLDFDVGLPRERSNTMEKLQSLLNGSFSTSRDAATASNPAFIEGGLYGSDWKSAGAPEINVVEASDASVSPCCTEGDTECSGEGLEGYSLHPVYVREQSSSADEACLSSDEASTVSGGSATLSGLQRLNSNSEITPSENTAFQDCIPPRMSLLQHVQSEPILSPSRMAQRCKQEGEVLHRLVQIKHLYKSDTSILKELGLANGSDYEEVDQKTELEISADRHFKPILTPPSHTAHLPDVCALDKTVTADSDGTLSSSNQSTVSGYQLFVSQETESSTTFKAFIPRFKIMKECEKSAQTGDVPPLEDDMTLTKRLVEDMNSMLESDDEDEGPSFTVQDIDSSLDQQPAECEGEVVYTEKAAGLSKEELVSLWTVEEDLEASHKTSIWSCGTDQDLPSLPGSCAGSWSVQAKFGPGWSTSQMTGCSEELTELGPGHDEDQAGPAEVVEAEADDVFLEKLLEPDSVLFPLETAAPHTGILYSSDLEEQWLSSEQQFAVQVPRRNFRTRKGLSRKPCSFFMEGSCRRSDCKFAHDMSSITCRFWEEGECFKGITCPFLHGYPDGSPETEVESAMAGFSLEQKDFPELASSDWEPAFGAGEKQTSAIRKLNQMNSADKSRVTFTAQKPRASASKQKPKSTPIDIKPKSK